METVKQLQIMGLMVAAFAAGSFIASPELRAYAANTVFSADIVDGEVKTPDLANNAVTAAKIKDGEVKAAEIATDAVGAAEIQGVSKLLFGECAADSSESSFTIAPGSLVLINCSINGVDNDDKATAGMDTGNVCFVFAAAATSTNAVDVYMKNQCPTNQSIGAATFGIIVFDK